MEAIQRKEELPSNYVLILHGESIDDELFAEWFVKRMEAIFEEKKSSSYNVCFQKRDLLIGTFERERVSNLINDRCKKVVALFSPRFDKKFENKWELEAALRYGLNILK